MKRGESSRRSTRRSPRTARNCWTIPKGIAACRDKLLAVIDTADTEQLKDLIRAVEAASESFVARRMNKSVRAVLAGKQIDEVEVR